MLIHLQVCNLPLRILPSKCLIHINKARIFLAFTPSLRSVFPLPAFGFRIDTFTDRVGAKFQAKAIKNDEEIESGDEEVLRIGEGKEFSSGVGNEDFEDDFKAVDQQFYSGGAYRGRQDQKDFDKDPELADILGSCFDDPKKAQSKVEERIRSKRSKILQTKTGSATPMKVRFNKFDFSNSYIWIEFYNTPLPQDAVRAWHIIGRLGGCNSMNMQLSQSAMDNKRPRYDAIQGANVTPTTFYNIGDLELQENLARIWIDIGTSEPLLLDVLVNALTCLSSE